MSDPFDLAVQANAILDRYIRVHDAVFKFSFGKLFRPINFAELRDALDTLLPELQHILSAHADPLDPIYSRFLSTLREYTSTLVDTITMLREICHQLALKAQDPLHYDDSTYQQDVSAYEESVFRYRQLGEQLNALHAELLTDSQT